MNITRPDPRWTTALVTCALLLGSGGLLTPVAAQAICSAPHSSPTLLQSAGNRTMPAGAGWIQLSTSFNLATESFNPLGSRERFIGASEFQTQSAYLTASYGLTDGLEIWGQVPVHRLRVEAPAGESRSTGVGDIRAAVRVSPALFEFEAPVTVRVGYKIPGSDFPVDATELPLTEGQEDFEVSLESGWTPGSLPLYVAGWSGYRWRAENEQSRHRPGNEWFAHAALGGTFRSLSWELGVDALWGEAPLDQGIRLTSQKRKLIQVVPTLATAVGPGLLEATVPVPVSGRNLPAGYGASIGYRLLWGG